MSEPVDVIHDYLRQIDKEMTCSKKKKKQFLKRLQNDMEEFAEEETALTKSDLEEHFGTPQSIAESFLETEPYSEVKQVFKFSKAFRICIIVVCSIIVLSVVGYIIYDNWREQEFAKGHIVTTLYEEVEGTPSPSPEGTIVYNDETEGTS